MTDKEGLNAEGGCAVDWSWLVGEKVAEVTNGLDTICFRFQGGRTFEVKALLWKGKPFLSFTPHAPPRAD
jgi:hypothetical protein